MNTPQTYELEIPAGQIANASAFEASRAGAYDQETSEKRQAALEQIVGMAQVAGGLVLSDVLLERLTGPEEQLERSKNRLEEISDQIVSAHPQGKHKEETYKFILDPSGKVVDVLHISPIAEDKLATSRSRRTAQAVGWGPRQNELSGKFGVPSRRKPLRKNKRS